MKLVSDSCCHVWCLLASGLFAAMLMVMLNPNKTDIIKRFQATLDENQNKIYMEIVKERLNIYLVGLTLGLILGFLYLQYNTSKVASRACVFTVLVLFTTNVFYLIVPKSKYMLPILNTEEQRLRWLDVYSEMKYRHILGALLGVISFLVLSYNL